MAVGSVLGVIFWVCEKSPKDVVITNFEECAAAGNPVMESYPAQCRTKDGLMFAQELGPRARAALACAVADIPDVEIDTVLDTSQGSVEVRWNDPQTGIEKFTVFPFDPANDFNGCSKSAKRVLRSVAATVVTGGPTSADGAPIGSIHNLPVPQAVTAVRNLAAKQMRVREGEVRVLTAYEKEWSNACLGMPGNVPEDMMCAEVITPGWEVTVEVGGTAYVYRTNADGTQIRPNY